MRKKIEITKKEKAFVDQMNLDYGRNAFIYYMNIKDSEGTPLNDLAMSDVSLIFNGWYKLEEEFKEGDFLYDSSGDAYYKVTNVGDGKLTLYPLENDINLVISSDDDNLIKVTEPWKIELLKLSRNSPTLKEGDILISDSGSIWINEDDESEDNMYKRLEGNNTVRFYPVENSIKLT